MERPRRKHRIGLALAALAVILVVAAALAPWKLLIEGRLKSMLESMGLQDVSLTLSEAGLKRLTLKNIAVGGKAPMQLGDITFDYSLADLLAPHIAAKATGFHFKAQNLNIATGVASADAVRNKATGLWRGEWEIRDVQLTGIDPPLPPLIGKGNFTTQAGAFVIEGRFASSDLTYKSNLRATFKFDEPDQSTLTITDSVMPWNGGTALIRNAVIPLKSKQDVTIGIELQHVVANTLMRSLLGERATATGTISGVLPVTFKADGEILVQKGNLQAETPGTIALMPDVIPGDNEQVSLVRDLLKNFHYKILSIQMDSAPDNHLNVLLTLEGNNPGVSQGRPVKLNVRLTGDVLNLIQQNMLWLFDPQKFIERGGK